MTLFGLATIGLPSGAAEIKNTDYSCMSNPRKKARNNHLTEIRNEFST